MPQEFNLPDRDDPDFGEKVVQAIKLLYEEGDKHSKNFTPISEPLDGNQVGDVFFDQDSGKLRIVTDDGIKTVSLDP